MRDPSILVTNDDGIDAHGIRTLADALESVGDVTVVAPADNQSWAGRDMTWHAGPTGIEETDRGYAVEGTPSDAVAVAVSVLDVDPDIVVSGVNDGMNLSAHILERSGTVGAAIEAVHFGLPAIAVSTADHTSPEPPHPDPDAFETPAEVAAFVTERVLADGLGEAEYLNVNVPAFPDDPEIHRTRPTREYAVEHDPTDEDGVALRDPGWQQFLTGESIDAPETDRHAVLNGNVSVTPMRLPRAVETDADFFGFDHHPA